MCHCMWVMLLVWADIAGLRAWVHKYTDDSRRKVYKETWYRITPEWRDADDGDAMSEGYSGTVTSD